jgi:hypothetical protein
MNPMFANQGFGYYYNLDQLDLEDGSIQNINIIFRDLKIRLRSFMHLERS